jgi:branched-chain amino acid transport system ATP-binding protein
LPVNRRREHRVPADGGGRSLAGTTMADAQAREAGAAASERLLEVSDVSVRFGGIVALDKVSFGVQVGEIAGLIGPNGAGKTTLFNCLSRLYECEGSIRFDGQPILQLPRHRIAALGIGRTFQNVALFSRMSVLENVMVGRHCRTSSGYVSNAFRLPAVGREEQATTERARELVHFVGLDALAETPVAALPFPMQKRVELARALASEPKLLLLDEPASGLNHDEVNTLGRLIRDIRDRLRMTVLLVEHHMSLVMSISDKVVALNFGRKIADGTPDQVRAHPEVIAAYLGAPT